LHGDRQVLEMQFGFLPERAFRQIFPIELDRFFTFL
jgi:hypothetical protein